MRAKTNERKEKREMGTEKGRSRAVFWVVAFVLAAALAVPGTALALTPAGTLITNQAKATWMDTNNNSYTMLSNETEVEVIPVYGILLNSPANDSGVPLDNVSYAYTIQNTGNATDNYALAIASNPGWSTSMVVDTNGNGAVDGGEPLYSTPLSVNAGDNAYIVVVVTIPAGTSDGVTADTTLTVTGEGVGTDDDASDVVTTTCESPVLGVLKNVRNITIVPIGTFDNTATAAPTQELEYRITVINSGSSNASTLVLSDPINVNTSYEIGSAVFNANGSGLTGATIEFSNTPRLSAPNYVYGFNPTDTDVSCGGVAGDGYDDCVTSVRWTMAGSMNAGGANFFVNFIVRVK